MKHFSAQEVKTLLANLKETTLVVLVLSEMLTSMRSNRGNDATHRSFGEEGANTRKYENTGRFCDTYVYNVDTCGKGVHDGELASSVRVCGCVLSQIVHSVR